MFLASMARLPLLVCLLAFYLVSCKLSISSAFRQLNALLRFFHISFFFDSHETLTNTKIKMNKASGLSRAIN